MNLYEVAEGTQCRLETHRMLHCKASTSSIHVERYNSSLDTECTNDGLSSWQMYSHKDEVTSAARAPEIVPAGHDSQ
jgi:hypothetical protein